MRLSLAQKVTLPLLGFGAQGDALEYLKSLGDWAALWDLQDLTGTTALADNVKLDVGRNVAPQTYAGYVPLGAEWSNPSGEIAHCDGTQAGLTELKRNSLLNTGQSDQYTFNVSNLTFGSVWVRAGATDGVHRVADGTYVETIVATGETFRIQASSDFVGDINLELVEVQQTGILDSSAYPGAEELNEAGASGTATAANWTPANNADLTNPSVGIIRVARNGSANPFAQQLAIVTIGKRYKVTGQARSDGVGVPRVQDGVTAYWQGTNSTDWQEVNAEGVAGSTGVWLQSSVVSVDGQYTEWRNLSVTEANPLNGDNDGATPNQALQPGIVAYSFDSVNDEVVVLSAELNSGITPLAGTMVALFKIGTAVWEDSTIRTLFRIYVDATNYITMKKGANVGEVIASYAGEGAAAVDIAHLTLNPTGTMSMIITFDIAVNEFKMLINGSQSGPTGAITAVMLGNITSAVIGSTGAGEYWDELVAHVGFMRRLMTATEIATYTGMLNLESGTAFDAGFDEGFI